MKKITLTGIGCVFSLALLAQSAQEKAVAEPVSAPELSVAEIQGAQLRPAKVTSNSASTVFWSEDFANGIPSGWTNQGYLQNTSGNLVTSSQANWEYRGPTTTPDVTVGSRGAYTSGTGVISSLSSLNGFVIFDSDYLDNGGTGSMGQGVAPSPHVGTLTTSTINLTGYNNVNLSFTSYARTFQSDFKVAVSHDNGTSFPDTFEVHSNLAVNVSTPTNERVTINISSVAGNQAQVKLMFIFDGTLCNTNGCGYYFWMIDDIALESVPLNQMQFVESSSGSDIHMYSNGNVQGPHTGHMPLDESNPLQFTAGVTNTGSATQYNVKLAADIYNNSVYQQTVYSNTIATLLPQDSIPLTAMVTSPVTLTSISDYEFELYTISDSISKQDHDPLLLPRPLEISLTDSIYSLDFGKIDNYAGTNNGILAAGIELNLSNPQTIEAVQIMLSSLTDTNGSLVVEIYDTAGFSFGSSSPGPQNQKFVQGYNIKASDPGTMTQIDFNTPKTLPAGGYYLVLSFITSGGSDPIRFANDQSVPQGEGTIFLSSQGGWYSQFINSLTYNAPLIRVAFQSNNNVGFSITDVTCPGDSTGSISALTNDPSATFYWSTGDSTSSISGLAAGQYQLTVWTTNSTSNYTLNVNSLSTPMNVTANVQDESCSNANNGSISLNVSGTSPFTYSWSNNANTPSVSNLAPGNYSVVITDSLGCTTTKNYTIAASTNSIAKPALLNGGTVHLCPGETTTLAVNNPYSGYQWSNGATTPTTTVDSTGTYYLMVNDGGGCTSYSDSVEVKVEQPYDDLEICMVTYELNSQYEAKVIFNNPNLGSIDSIILMEKPLGLQSNFSIGGVLNTPGGNEIFDTVTNVVHFIPATDYGLVVTDTCGNRSSMSKVHRSMSLSASRDSSGGARLNWSPYQGLPVLKYRIYRAGQQLNNITLLDSVSKNTLSYVGADTSLSPRFYFVEAVFDTALSCSNAPYQGSLSPLEWYNPLSEEEWLISEMKLFPNPSSGQLNIENPGDAVEMEIYDLSGKLVLKSQLKAGLNQLNIDQLNPGTYLLKLKGKAGALKFSKR